MTTLRHPRDKPAQPELRRFFLSHLNRIYCAKKQLADKLPELQKNSYYLDLRHAIGETIEIVNNQIARIREIYIRLDAFYQPESCTGLVGILDEAFQSVGVPGISPDFRDLSLLFYMQNIESVELASFNMLMFIAGKIDDPGTVQLLRECFDEAKEDKALLKQITANYM